MEEKWETLVYQKISYDNYEISNLGYIRNKITGNTLKILETKSGNKNGTPYLATSIGLGKRGNSKIIIIHRAIAENFIDNPKDYRYVRFRDNNYKNISVENLYWSKHRKGDEHYNEYIKVKRRKANNSKAVADRRRKIKEMAIEYKGGQCIFCGYNRCIGALEFHHLNPEEKDFSIASTGTTKSWERVKKELDKCICVCANCHREIHNGIIFMEKIKKKVA